MYFCKQNKYMSIKCLNRKFFNNLSLFPGGRHAPLLPTLQMDALASVAHLLESDKSI